MLQQLDTFLGFNFVDFEQILKLKYQRKQTVNIESAAEKMKKNEQLFGCFFHIQQQKKKEKKDVGLF